MGLLDLLKKKPEKVEKPEPVPEGTVKKEKTDLLLEYEELLREQEDLKADLDEAADELEEFASLIRQIIIANPFELRHGRMTAKSLMEDFEVEWISSYQQIKEDAIECEKVFFQLFTLKQKLKLHGLGNRFKEENNDL